MFIFFLAFALTKAQIAVHRINVGGGSYLDSLGNSWQTDMGYNEGNTYSIGVGITNTADQTLYQTERWDPITGNEMVYSLPVVAGQQEEYQVILHFADIYSGTHAVGKRIFDVLVEDQLILDKLDIFAEVGGYAALTKSFRVNVSDGILDIKFIHQIENPKISAIEVLLLPDLNNKPPIVVASATPTQGDKALVVEFNGAGSSDPEGQPITWKWHFGDDKTSSEVNPIHVYQEEGVFIVSLTVTDNKLQTNSTSITITVTDGHNKGDPIFRINAGGPSYTDSQGKVWYSDQFYNTGNTFYTNNLITGTDDPVLYQSERWDSSQDP